MITFLIDSSGLVNGARERDDGHLPIFERDQLDFPGRGLEEMHRRVCTRAILSDFILLRRRTSGEREATYSFMVVVVLLLF